MKGGLIKMDKYETIKHQTKFGRLNEEVEKFKMFGGEFSEDHKYWNNMQRIIAEGRSPMTINQIMERRLDLRFSDDKQLRKNWDYGFNTSDGLIYSPNGDLIIAHDADVLREISSEEEISKDDGSYGWLVLENSNLDNIEGVKFSRSQLEGMIIRDSLTRNQAINHPIWQAVAREENYLLKSYVDMVFGDHAIGVFGHPVTEHMMVSLDSNPSMCDTPSPQENSVILPLLINEQERRPNIKASNLGRDCSPLIGIAPDRDED
jgi:hypothetical protein|tara:strand:+ start:4771 stop:5556 length:786 start_codon:yes stop_codon:yes gene_type:complete